MLDSPRMRLLVLTLLCAVTCYLPQRSQAASNQYFYLSWSGNLSGPQPELTAERSDTRIKWFDDKPQAQDKLNLELGAYLPKDYRLVLRYKDIEGTHLGEAARYQCFLFFCSFISGSVLSGLPSNDRVSYRIKSGQVWVEKAPFDTFPGLRIRGGINVVNAQLVLAGAGLERTNSWTFPLPFLGVAVTKELFWNLSLLAETNYSEFEKKQVGVTFRDSSIGVSAKLHENLSVVAGIRKNSIHTSYQKDTLSATLKIPQSTPYLAITISY